MKRCIYCNRQVLDHPHGPRELWDWEAIAKEGHDSNCVWIRTKGVTGMPADQQKMLIETQATCDNCENPAIYFRGDAKLCGGCETQMQESESVHGRLEMMD